MREPGQGTAALMCQRAGSSMHLHAQRVKKSEYAAWNEAKARTRIAGQTSLTALLAYPLHNPLHTLKCLTRRYRAQRLSLRLSTGHPKP